MKVCKEKKANLFMGQNDGQTCLDQHGIDQHHACESNAKHSMSIGIQMQYDKLENLIDVRNVARVILSKF